MTISALFPCFSSFARRLTFPSSGLGRAGIFLGIFLSLGLAGCGGQRTAPGPVLPSQPLVAPLETPEQFVRCLHPGTQELRSWKELGPTIRKSLAYLGRKPDSGIAVSRPGLRVTWGELRTALQDLQGLLPSLDANPNLFLEKFRWVPVKGGIKYTSYYALHMRASRTKKGDFTRPLYRMPPDIAAYKASHGGKYYTRKQIDGDGVLAGRGLELAWATPVDVFLLQIEGAGVLMFDDGTQAFINYAGQNGHKYKPPGRIMREHGIKFRRGDILEQRQWFKDNPSYVFFCYGMRGSTGAMGQVLDDWLSLATDPSFLPLGSIVAYGVNASGPKAGTFALRGIGFAQDTGGAIKKNRIDIYAGRTDRGNYAASLLDAKGPAWVLLRR